MSPSERQNSAPIRTCSPTPGGPRAISARTLSTRPSAHTETDPVSPERGKEEGRRRTHQKILRRLPLVRILEQAVIHKRLRLFWEPRELWRRLVDDVLQQLEDAHRHPPALEAHALALPLVLLRRVGALAPRRGKAERGERVDGAGACGGEGALEVGEVRVVGEGLGEGEAAEGELDKGDAEGPDVGFDGVYCALDTLGLRGGASVSGYAWGRKGTHAHVC
jgi:hypothetical protein